MRHLRLTRQESRNQTRQRLCDSAQAVFMKKGFAAASVEDIVKAAGYTRGAFYSNFHNKVELLLELLRRDQETIRAVLHKISGEGATREEMEARVLDYYGKLNHDRKHCLLWMEAKLLATRDGRFRVCFNVFLHEKLEQLSAYVREFSARAGTPLPMHAETLAIGLMGLLDGVRFYHVLDPLHVTEHVAESVLSEFFARVVLGRRAERADDAAPILRKPIC
ncbi:transcriptional regulator, TetR family [Paraburkholderia steynii]|uniref:Transcriptional regulator, TetR family n=1 Tax=Paraburkholderia steynii TaxID=1245441 RepID=A0A7Z7BAW5_9BURK|nr:TetR/AcrR family transcriptional regulator [Paraburkholderia steynii]SDI49394.1 transcriptional regulator, TetR family [Paraburkholderia steynii]